MKKGFALLSLMVLNLCLPAELARGSAYDIVCKFKYRTGDNGWVEDTASGTTRRLARRNRRAAVEFQEGQARKAGLEFEVIYLTCEDPWGGDSGKPD
ncbi:MAG: hypothetical protein ACRC8A_00695 [Microcoleaceae cyanobacterium]